MGSCAGNCITGNDLIEGSGDDVVHVNPECPTHGTRHNPVAPPYDPNCDTYAKDMTSYDNTIRAEYYLEEDEEVTPEMREQFVRSDEGTFNVINGHFACDSCYIKLGCPSSPRGWKCP